MTLNRLTGALAALCREYLLEEKWLLAPSLRVGNQWLEQVARAGVPVVNLRVRTVKSLAVDIALPDLSRLGVSVATRRASLFLIDEEIRRLRAAGLRYFAGAADGAGLARAFLRSVNDLRLAGVSAGELRRGRFEGPEKGSELGALLSRYEERLREERLVDYAGVLDLAEARLGGGTPAATARCLVPGDLELTVREKRLLGALPPEGLVELPVDDGSVPPGVDVHFFSAVGEISEVRAVLRRCAAAGIPLDEVELLHTDARTFLPLVTDVFAAVDRPGAVPGEAPPVTFAEGIPCDRSRPGRALLGWLHWINGGYEEAVLRRLVREGLLETGSDGVGFARLAALLRGAGIGFGRDRYRGRIDERLRATERRLESGLEDGEGPEREGLRRDREGLVVLRRLTAALLAGLPDPAGGQRALAEAAAGFLRERARRVDRLDEFAAAKLLDEIDETARWLDRTGGRTGIDVAAWLLSLPEKVRVLGSGPRPGCLHVDSVPGGGHSGRPYTFVVGLDDSRFPGARLQDPVLLDSERRSLHGALPTAAAAVDAAGESFRHLCARLRGTVSFSYACRSDTDERESYPAAVLAGLLRDREGPGGEPSPAVSFAPAAAAECLDLKEWWLWRLTGGGDASGARPAVMGRYPHLARGFEAAEARQGPKVTGWDGRVPRAGADFDPAAPGGPVCSAHSLQAAAACPLRFFLRYALRIEPPDDVVVDPLRWLDHAGRGRLLHEVFEVFLREHADHGRAPRFEADRGRLEAVFARTVGAFRELIPPPSEAVFRREEAELRVAAETFLREEERHCAARRCLPVYLEASLGIPSRGDGTPLDRHEPVTVALPSGASIRLRGRVDRVDRVRGDGEQGWMVWDYKTGGSGRYRKSDPFRQGRALQPFLYLVMVGGALAETVGPAARVVSSGFFFPAKKAAGARLEWTPGELAAGGTILEQVRGVIAAGAFVPTTDAGEDCGLCDYRPVCGDQAETAVLAAGALRKLAAEENRELEDFRRLRCGPPARGGEDA